MSELHARDADEARGTTEPDELPPFAVRRSSRARRVRLTVTPRDGLVVVLPPGAPARAATEAVRAKQAWARRSLARVADHRVRFEAGPDALLPDVIELRALGVTWPVEYRDTASGTARAIERGAALVVTGPVSDADAALDALRRWRSRTAAGVLPDLLGKHAVRLGVHPQRVVVRGQKTRWGSCSARGTISLNRDLIFLPEHLVDYVMVHELAHLVHRNHSARFYEQLESWYPDTRSARAEMREGWRHVPAWAMA